MISERSLLLFCWCSRNISKFVSLNINNRPTNNIHFIVTCRARSIAINFIYFLILNNKGKRILNKSAMHNSTVHSNISITYLLNRISLLFLYKRCGWLMEWWSLMAIRIESEYTKAFGDDDYNPLNVILIFI